MKKIIILATAVLVTLPLFAGSIYASEKGNKVKGKFLYRKIYKTCHKRDSSVSKKPSVSPDEKTMAQWDRIFDKKRFKGFGCSNEWSAMSDEDLLHIRTYLKSGAADSPTPAKCK